MARIRKINVSQVEGNNDAVLPAGTIAAYDINNEYVLRVHDGITPGGVPFPNAPSIIHNNDINITVNSGDSSSYTWNFGQTGTLTAPGDVVAGGVNGGHFIIDGTDGDNTSVRWYNMPSNENHSIIRTFTGNPDQGTELNRGRIQLAWQDANRSGLRITSYDRSDDNNEVLHSWTFQGNGDLVLPPGGDILDSEGNSVLGGGNSNVWVETFASDTPVTDQVQIATSVEYDANGNIFALFSHLIPGGDNETYASVAKLSPTGTVVWQLRFNANLNTDGWGLAYDGENSVYVAGSTSGTPLTYDFATLTKIDAFDGTIVWNKTYDFEADSQSAVVDVDSDGNPIMVGYASNGTDNYITTTKVNQADGTVIWSKTLDGQGDDEAYGMAVGPTGEVVTVGYMDQLGVIDGVATLYADNNPNWTGGGLGASNNGVNFSVTVTAGVATFSNISDTIGNRSVDDVIATINGSVFGGVDGVDDMVVKVGTLAANDLDDRMLIVKYNSAGAIQWQKAVQFDANGGCRGADADIDADGNIYVCGNYDTEIGAAMSLVKFNSSGVEQWSRRVVGNCADFATSVVVGPDNNLYLSGVTIAPDVETVTWAAAKYSTTGSVVWQRLIENTASWTFTGGLFFNNAGGSNIAVGPDYVALAGGFGTLGPGGDPTATVVQIDTNGTLFSIGNWALTAASFTGNLDDSASDITVVNAGKTAGTVTPTVADFVVEDDSTNFLIGTLYNAPGGDDSLVNGEYSVILGNTGAVTLPAGGTITEGFVTSNPTIQLTPATPTVASQKLVIKGGGNYSNTENGITVTLNNITQIVGDVINVYVESVANADQTLYWWIYPESAGLADPGTGTVILDEFGDGNFTFELDSDDYEFTVRVSPEDNNYDPDNTGAESVLINGDEPTFEGEHHLHLTTGDLEVTSIILGTDNHNVRTTVDGGISMTTTRGTVLFGNIAECAGGESHFHIMKDDPNNVDLFFGDDYNYVKLPSTQGVEVNANGSSWTFGTDGSLTIPGDIRSEGNINIDINLSDSTLRRWSFGEDGDLTFPDNTVQTTAYTGITTVAKTGVPADTGIPVTLSGGMTGLGIADGTYGPFTKGNVTFEVTVSSGGISGYINISSTTSYAVNDTIGQLTSEDLGDAPGQTTNISVDAVDQGFMDIDLTKSVNKLTDGYYYLADGVEGQIMYLVRQNGSTAANIFVLVASGRLDGTVYPDEYVVPFQIPFTDMVTIIFTDGAWQSSTLSGV